MNRQDVEHTGLGEVRRSSDSAEPAELECVGVFGPEQAAEGGSHEHLDPTEGAALLDEGLHEGSRFGGALSDENRVARAHMPAEVDRRRQRRRSARTSTGDGWPARGRAECRRAGHDLLAPLVDRPGSHVHAVFAVGRYIPIRHLAAQADHVAVVNEPAVLGPGFNDPSTVTDPVRQKMDVPALPLKAHVILQGHAHGVRRRLVVVHRVDRLQCHGGGITEGPGRMASILTEGYAIGGHTRDRRTAGGDVSHLVGHADRTLRHDVELIAHLGVVPEARLSGLSAPRRGSRPRRPRLPRAVQR